MKPLGITIKTIGHYSAKLAFLVALPQGTKSISDQRGLLRSRKEPNETAEGVHTRKLQIERNFTVDEVRPVELVATKLLGYKLSNR